jgi:hypothetical protein
VLANAELLSGDFAILLAEISRRSVVFRFTVAGILGTANDPFTGPEVGLFLFTKLELAAVALFVG